MSWQLRARRGSGGSASIGRAHSSLGEAGVWRLLPVQVFHSIGETMFVVSLAGSLFFRVSLDAARPSIILYLAVSMAPFVVLAPLVGRVIDRARGGHRVVLLVTLIARMTMALVLADQLRGLWFYPEVFVMLVLARSFSVSRNTIVPALVRDHDHLVIVNARLARTGAIAGALASPVAVLVMQTAGAAWVLRLGAVAYGIGALLAWRLPASRPDVVVSPVVERVELSGSRVRSATFAMAAMRAAVGFSVFHVGFVLKIAGEPLWYFGALAALSGLGGFLGTFAASRLRQRLSQQAVLTLTLAPPALAAVVAGLRFHRVTLAVLMLALGLCASTARRAFDGVVQSEAPHARRGQTYTLLETQIELAWALGALLAVVARASDWLGVVLLAAWLIAVAVTRVANQHTVAAVAEETSRRALPVRLLETADALAAQGDPHQAAIVALVAAKSIEPPPEPSQQLQTFLQTPAAALDADDAEEVLRLAHDYCAVAYPLASSNSG